MDCWNLTDGFDVPQNDQGPNDDRDTSKRDSVMFQVLRVPNAVVML